MSKKLIRSLRGLIALLASGTGLLSLIYLSGCTTNNNEGPAPTKNLWELVQNTEGLDSLKKYLARYPDLVSTLQSTGTFTLFAPNNEAFISLMATPGFPSDISLINPNLIKGVLLYHASDQAYTKGEIKPGTDITTLEGEKITVNNDGTLKTGATNPNIQIDKADLKATNGIMHTTKSVLIPPSVGATLTPLLGTVGGTLMLAADFSTLASAIQKADSTLGSGEPSLISIFSTTTAPVTVFAPPNEVFAQAGIKVSDYSGATWRAIILYHCVSGTKTKADLTNRSYTSLFGEGLYVSRVVNNSDTVDYINGYPMVVPNAVPASNGIVHILGGFLIPGQLLGGTLEGVVQAQGLDSLARALELTGLGATLNGANEYTLLAPPNAAFDSLLVHMGATALNQIPTNTLTGLISYHIISGYRFTPDFTNETNYSTLAGINVKANVTADGITFTDGSGAVVPVVYVNIKATNGVIHIIGGILQPQ